MTRLGRLKKQAKEAAEFRGHTLSKFGMFTGGLQGRIHGYYSCLRCGRLAVIDTAPPPNGADIMGEAVALNCTKKG